MSEIDRTSYYRGMILLGAFLMVVFGIYSQIAQSEKYDPFWMRLSIASYGAGISTASFFSPWVKDRMKYFLYIGTILITSWILIMLYNNDFSQRFTSLSYIALVAIAFAYTRISHLILYLVGCIIGTTVTWYIGLDTHNAPPTFLVHYILTGVVTFVILYYLINTQQKLFNSNETFTALLNTTDESYLLLDRDHRIVKYNQKARQYMRIMRGLDIANGDDFPASMAPADQEAIRNWINDALSGRSHKFEYEFLSADGDSYWFEVKYTPVYSKDGEIIYVSFTSLNITERKRGETLLIKSKEAAEEASKAKADFLSTMSHEIRTPMNAVIGMTHLLLDENPQTHQLEYLNSLQFSARNLLGIINDILDFSKIEAGKITLENQPFSLINLINNLKQTFDPKAEKKGIKFTLMTNAKLPHTVKGDEVRLTQIMTNLLNNAIKFTEQGSVELNVIGLKNDGRKAKVYFSIRDTGIGIPAQKINDIFDDFTQARSDTTRVYGGTGLGLAITKRLLELQSSELKVNSIENQGSEFFFTLDVEIADAGLVTPIIQFQEKDLKRSRILLAEDHEINQMLATRFLEKWNSEYDVALNGREAVEKIQKNTFDLVLMDLQMPEMDGIEATKTIRSMGNGKSQIPIIALTASAMLEVQEQIFHAGMNDFVTKPFDPDELYQKISTLINQGS